MADTWQDFGEQVGALTAALAARPIAIEKIGELLQAYITTGIERKTEQRPRYETLYSEGETHTQYDTIEYEVPVREAFLPILQRALAQATPPRHIIEVDSSDDDSDEHAPATATLLIGGVQRTIPLAQRKALQQLHQQLANPTVKQAVTTGVETVRQHVKTARDQHHADHKPVPKNLRQLHQILTTSPPTTAQGDANGLLLHSINLFCRLHQHCVTAQLTAPQTAGALGALHSVMFKARHLTRARGTQDAYDNVWQTLQDAVANTAAQPEPKLSAPRPRGGGGSSGGGGSAAA